MINTKTVCQTTSYSLYRGGVAISELLVTGTRGQDTNKAWDLNNMPTDRVGIAPKAFSPETRKQSHLEVSLETSNRKKDEAVNCAKKQTVVWPVHTHISNTGHGSSSKGCEQTTRQ